MSTPGGYPSIDNPALESPADSESATGLPTANAPAARVLNPPLEDQARAPRSDTADSDRIVNPPLAPAQSKAVAGDTEPTAAVEGGPAGDNLSTSGDDPDSDIVNPPLEPSEES